MAASEKQNTVGARNSTGGYETTTTRLIFKSFATTAIARNAIIRTAHIKMALLDPKNMASLLAESEGKQVLISCDDHQYFPGSKLSRPQMLGCRYCIMARLYYDFSKISPDKREEHSEKLERLVNHMAEDIERGTFDVNLYDRPKITVENVDDDSPLILP